jgi:pyruvate formate lyase activating enzyme
MLRIQEDERQDAGGLVFNIQRYSIHDGPGIRTVVFLKGCPLRCAWCDNPESQKFSPEVMFFEKECIGCGACIEVCKANAIAPSPSVSTPDRIFRDRCSACGACVERCPAKALRMVGKTMSSEDIIGEVLKDKRFYEKSGGGVTISGGEPLAQSDLTAEILMKSHHHNVHTAIETSGYASWKTLQGILQFTDLLLFDLKHMDPRRHQELTGVSNAVILENIERAAKLRRIIIRVPIIPDCNDSAGNIAAVAALAKKTGIEEIHLLPFHQLGSDKYERLSMKYVFKNVPSVAHRSNATEKIDRLRELLLSRGLLAKIGG